MPIRTEHLLVVGGRGIDGMSILDVLWRLLTQDFLALIITVVVVILFVPDIVRFIKDVKLGWRYGLRCPKCGNRVRTSMADWDDNKKGWVCQS